MTALIIALFLLFSSPSQAAADKVCEDLASAQEIYSCLNRYARGTLEAGSTADQLFQERLTRLLSKYNLKPEQVRTKSLMESFSILVDQRSQIRGVSQTELCFPFDSYSRSQKSKAVKALREQIDQSALFLAELHANSWGHQVSLLFPIKEISICSRRLTNKRAVVFEQRSLVLGFQKTAMPAQEILAAWNSGNPIRSTELTWASSIPVLGRKVRAYKQVAVKKDLDGVLRDKLADNWMVLNPGGSLRTTALYTLAEALIKMREVLGDEKSVPSLNQMFTLMHDTAKGKGFTPEQREKIESLRKNDLAVAGLFNLWRQKLESPQNILFVLENAIGDQAQRDANLHLVMRKIRAGVSVANDKNIIVRIEQLMQTSIPVSKFEDSSDKPTSVEITRTDSVRHVGGKVESKTTTFKVDGQGAGELSVNADDVAAGVSVNLIDNVVVSVQLPKVSPAAYTRISLHQALEEFVMP